MEGDVFILSSFSIGKSSFYYAMSSVALDLDIERN